MCQHKPPCPQWNAVDRQAARVVAAHPEQGWSLLCNGVVLFDDDGELLPDGRQVPPRPPALPPARRRDVAAPRPFMSVPPGLPGELRDHAARRRSEDAGGNRTAGLTVAPVACNDLATGGELSRRVPRIRVRLPMCADDPVTGTG